MGFVVPKPPVTYTASQIYRMLMDQIGDHPIEEVANDIKIDHNNKTISISVETIEKMIPNHRMIRED